MVRDFSDLPGAPRACVDLRDPTEVSLARGTNEAAAHCATQLIQQAVEAELAELLAQCQVEREQRLLRQHGPVSTGIH